MPDIAELIQLLQRDLAAVVERLSSIQQIAENHLKAEENERRRQQEREQVPIQVTGTFRLPEAVETQRTANQKRYYTTQRVIAIAACAAFVAGVAAAVITGLQLKEMRAQTAQLYKQMKVSERAYLVLTVPTLDSANGVVTLVVNNNGKIPSGETDIIIHEATYDQANTDPHAVERHWKKHVLPPVGPGKDIFEIKMPLAAFSRRMMAAGTQGSVIAGSIAYNDGFSDDPPQKWPFCWQGEYRLVLKRTVWTPCDPDKAIPAMEKLDGYPHGEQTN